MTARPRPTPLQDVLARQAETAAYAARARRLAEKHRKPERRDNEGRAVMKVEVRP